MPEADDLSADQIAIDAQNPASGSVDGVSVNSHSLSEKIKADQYRRGKQALAGTNAAGGPKSAWGATRIARHKPLGMHE